MKIFRRRNRLTLIIKNVNKELSLMAASSTPRVRENPAKPQIGKGIGIGKREILSVVSQCDVISMVWRDAAKGRQGVAGQLAARMSPWRGSVPAHFKVGEGGGAGP